MTDTSPHAELEEMRARKDGAYEERNRCVSLIARMALAMGFSAGTARTAIEGWSEDWHGCVYVDLPSGQVSWHYHDSHAHLFEDLPGYIGKWDGHDTPEKYRRVDAAGRGVPLPQTNELRHEMMLEQEGAFLFMAAFVRKLGGKVRLRARDLQAATKLELERAEMPDGGFSIRVVPVQEQAPKSLLVEHVPVIARVQ